MYHIFEGVRKSSIIYEYGGFEHRRNKTGQDGGTIYLRCCTESCKGRGFIKNDVFTLTTDHDHAPFDEEHFILKKARTSMKRSAEESASSLKDIFDAVSRDQEVNGRISFHSIESTMRKRRRKNLSQHPEDTTRGR